jgi:hypothetical protein
MARVVNVDWVESGPSWPTSVMVHPGWHNLRFSFYWGSSSSCWRLPPAVKLSSGTVSCNRNSNLLCQCILTIIIGLSYFCYKGFEEIVACWRNYWKLWKLWFSPKYSKFRRPHVCGFCVLLLHHRGCYKRFEVTWHWRFILWCFGLWHHVVW